MKCLMKYDWVKLMRSHLPQGKGVMGHWAKLASRAAFRKGHSSYCGYTNEVEAGMWSGGIVGVKSILEVKSKKLAFEILDNLSELGYITYMDYVNFVKCKKGDCFFIPAGMLHAIGKGLLIAEIQQNSDTTYRVYDYDRRDAQGNTRELHIEKAIEVTTLSETDINRNTIVEGIIADCEYFTTEKISVNGVKEIRISKDRFEIIVICDGDIEIDNELYHQGDTILVPAYYGSLHVSGNANILRTYIRA